MPITVTMEELPAEARRVIESMLSAGEPVILSRNGEPIGAVSSRPVWADGDFALTEQDIREIEAAVRQGDEDFAAGRFMTIHEFRTKYASQLGEEGT